MILKDYFGNRIYEEIESKFVDCINKKKLQKILIKCCKETRPEVGVNEEFVKLIMNIDSEKIRPNLSVDKIYENLRDIFESFIGNKSIEFFIIKKYKEYSYEEVLELYHIQQCLDMIDKEISAVGLNVKKQYKTIESIDKKVTKIPEEICSELKERRKTELCFIDELDYSKRYFYFELEFLESIDGMEEKINSIFEMLENNTTIGANLNYKYNDLLDKISVQFYNPIQQILFREYLRTLDRMLFENEISIFSVCGPW